MSDAPNFIAISNYIGVLRSSADSLDSAVRARDWSRGITEAEALQVLLGEAVPRFMRRCWNG